MSGGRVSSREAKTALNSAANMAAVFRDAGELSLERELTFVCEQLRKNEPLLYRLSGYLKDDSLVALLDGRMNATVEQNDEALSREKNKNNQNGKVLRQAWKKWEHIEGSQAFLISLLRAAWGLEVNSVCPECLKINEEPADNKKLLGSFLMLMRQKSQWRMPHWTHEPGAVKMQEDVFGPCRQRALETHEKFEPFKKWTATDFLKGYYLVLDNNGGIACTLPPPDEQGGPVIYKVDGATDYYVNNPYEPDSDYSFMLAGGRARMAGLSGYFVEQGITFPELTDWKFHGLEFKTPEAQGKRRRPDDDNGFEPSAASGDITPNKGARTSTVAAALRHRLAKADSAVGTTVKTEPCAEEAVEAAPSLPRSSKKR